MLLLPEPGGNVRIDVDLAQDVVAAADQDDQLGFCERVAGEVIAGRAHIGNVLICFRGHRRAAHPHADGDPRVLRLAPRVRLERQLGAVQHVGVYRRIGRAQCPKAVARHLKERAAADVVQVGGAQRADDLPRVGNDGHDARFPRTAVTRCSTPSRFTTIITVSPA
jgi:hypothetical protein